MTLRELIEERCEYEDVRSYSGRGMYGDECLGVVVEDAPTFILKLGFEIGQASGEGEDEDNPPPKLPRRMEVDSMGRSSQIVYFPGVLSEDTDPEGAFTEMEAR